MSFKSLFAATVFASIVASPIAAQARRISASTKLIVAGNAPRGRAARCRRR